MEAAAAFDPLVGAGHRPAVSQVEVVQGLGNLADFNDGDWSDKE